MQPESLKKPVGVSLRKGSGSREPGGLGGMVNQRMMGSPKTSGLTGDYKKKLQRMNMRLET